MTLEQLNVAVARVYRTMPENPADAFEVIMCLLAWVFKECANPDEMSDVLTDWMTIVKSGAAYRDPDRLQ